MNKVYNIFFSPTGNSRKAAEQIGEAFDCEKAEIDLCGRMDEITQIEKESLCVFSVPCYGGRIPQTAAQRLLRIHGNQTPAVVCVTFGNRAYEDALLELADLVEGNGFQVIAGCAAVSEHNIMHVFGKGRPDASDQEELQRFSGNVAKKVNSQCMDRPVLPGNRPYKEWHGSAMPILVDEKTCINCGVCASECPVKAISPDGRSVNKDVCISCMRCIQICPRKSRSIPEEALNGLIQRLQPACESRKENEFYL